MDTRVVFACLMALLPAVFAQGTTTATEGPWTTEESNSTIPDRCCWPASQFTITKSGNVGVVPKGVFGRLFGGLAILEEQYQAYDYNNSRVAAYIIRRFIDGKPEEHVHLIEDLEEKTVYVIYPYAEKCELRDAEDFGFHTGQCIPEYAAYFGSSYVGDKTAYSDSWGFYLPDEPIYPTNGFFSYTVGEDCIVHSETFAGNSKSWDVNQQVVSSYGYINYKEGLSDSETESYFTVPDYCEEKPRKNGESSGSRPDRPPKGRKN